ncbi:DUF2158 domain-containing protein [Roseomonas sp. ACRSG]|nr:DUF2158 domain-containing protein [Roseomonas sp. ACRSG]
MANAFNKGDVVVLKSGGPPMTVDEVPGDRQFMGGERSNYRLEWFKGATPVHGEYAEHLLKKFTPPVKK